MELYAPQISLSAFTRVKINQHLWERLKIPEDQSSNPYTYKDKDSLHLQSDPTLTSDFQAFLGNVKAVHFFCLFSCCGFFLFDWGLYFLTSVFYLKCLNTATDKSFQVVERLLVATSSISGCGITNTEHYNMMLAIICLPSSRALGRVAERQIQCWEGEG